jgi:hypothetical protein
MTKTGSARGGRITGVSHMEWSQWKRLAKQSQMGRKTYIGLSRMPLEGKSLPDNYGRMAIALIRRLIKFVARALQEGAQPENVWPVHHRVSVS